MRQMRRDVESYTELVNIKDIKMAETLDFIMGNLIAIVALVGLLIIFIIIHLTNNTYGK